VQRFYALPVGIPLSAVVLHTEKSLVVSSQLPNRRPEIVGASSGRTATGVGRSFAVCRAQESSDAALSESGTFERFCPGRRASPIR